MPTCSNRTSNPRRLKNSLPLRPTRPSVHDCLLSTTKWPAALITLVLKLPHSPLSAVTTMTSVRLSAFGSRTVSSGWIDGSTREATLPSTRCICTAYGRALMTRSCARRSFDAATIFIALVICCVFLTARIRRRRSIRDGIYAAADFLAVKSALKVFTAASRAPLS